MNERIVVRKGTYHDSAFLMRVTRELKGLPGIGDAVVVMGTQMNRELLAQAGFDAGKLDGATPMDMVVALRGDAPEALDAADAELARLLEGGARSTEQEGPRRCRTLQEAAREHPEANLVSISVPGAYAAYVAHRALDAGRHVFLFSNNVPLADELALKRRGRDLGLLVMGPDCGTAIVAGVGQGFANRVPRGRIGVVGASGTGIQDVTCTIAQAGEGISHAIGTGSRDLSVEVDGAMTEMGLRLLAEDPGTRIIVLVAKHPAPAVAERMHDVLRGLGKPVVVRYLGKPPRAAADGVHYAATLDEAALTAVALASDRKGAVALEPANAVSTRAKALLGSKAKLDGRMVGLFGGGSLASEARVILERHGLQVFEPEGPMKMDGPVEFKGNLLVDTGEDFYTVGKPHPMVDQTVRCALIRKAGADPTVGLILMDLVLGYGSHANPAPEIAEAVADARTARRGTPLVVVASITGTNQDTQGLAQQKAVLEAAGVEVRPSAARAAMLAAALLGGAERSER